MPKIRPAAKKAGLRGSVSDAAKLQKITLLSKGYAEGMSAKELAKLVSIAYSTVFQEIRRLRDANPSIEAQRRDALKALGKTGPQRGKMKNPLNKNEPIHVKQRHLLRVLRDKAYFDAYAKGISVDHTAKLFEKSPQVVSKRISTLKVFDPSLEQRRKEGLKTPEPVNELGMSSVPRGRPANPVTQQLKLEQARRTMLRSFRDRGLSEGYAQGMNVHTLADMFGKDTAGAFQRITHLKAKTPSITTRREEAIANGAKRDYNLSPETVKKREASRTAKDAKAFQLAQNREKMEKRNNLLLERYAEGAVGGALIEGLGVTIMNALLIARGAAEENPVLEYKRKMALLAQISGSGKSTQKGLRRALSWIREDLAEQGKDIARRDSKQTRSFSEIRRSVQKGAKYGMLKEVSIESFMQTNRLNPKTMSILSTAFLSLFNKTTHLAKNSLEVADAIRKKVPSLPESMIREYSNWVYGFTQKKGNRSKLVAFRKKFQKGLIKSTP